MERNEMFPMATVAASMHLRSRGYDCRPAMLDVLVKNGVVSLAQPDVWTREDVDAAAEYFEQSEMFVPYAAMCATLGLRGAAVNRGEIAWSGLVAHVDRRMTDEDILKHMPARQRQVPIPAGAVPYTVLGRLEVRSPAGSPAVPVPMATPTPGTSSKLDGELLIAPFTPAQAAAARAAAASRLGAPETATKSIGLRLTLVCALSPSGN